MYVWTIYDVVNFAVMWGCLVFGIVATRPNSKLLFKKPDQEKIKRRLHLIVIIGLLVSVCSAIASIVLGVLGYE